MSPTMGEWIARRFQFDARREWDRRLTALNATELGHAFTRAIVTLQAACRADAQLEYREGEPTRGLVKRVEEQWRVSDAAELRLRLLIERVVGVS